MKKKQSLLYKKSTCTQNFVQNLNLSLNFVTHASRQVRTRVGALSLLLLRLQQKYFFRSPDYKQRSAFTLIELLVVIVIIGILATISVAQFNTYAAKARDAKRIQIVTTIAKILKYEDLDNFDAMKRYKVSSTELYQHLDDLGYSLDTSVGNYCFYFSSTPYTNAGSYDDNQFIISTWGEQTSSHRAGESGPIFAGSVLAEQNYKQLENIHHNSTNNYDDWIEGMDNWYECAVDRDALSNDGNGNNGIGSPHSTFYHGVSDLWDSRSYYDEATAAGKTYVNPSWYTTQN